MKLLLLDSNSLVNRAYFAMPALTDPSGRPTGGVFGFVNMLVKLIAEEKPTHIACAFDVHAPTFRHKQYAEYKAGRKPMAEELKAQIPLLKELLEKMQIKVVELAGYEADDILGTLSKWASCPTIVVSGDKDVLQLVSDNVTVLHTKRGITDVIRYTPARLAEEGLEPSQVPELKGLMGDSSDNIKGVNGVGEKTARQLLADYHDLDGIYAHIDEIKGKLREKLAEGKEDAYFSRDLATIYRSVPLEMTLEDCVFQPKMSREVETMLRQLDFRKLVDKFDYIDEPVKVDVEVKTIPVESLADFDALMAKAEGAKQVALSQVGENYHVALDEATEFVVTPGKDLLSDLDPDHILRGLSRLFAKKGLNKVVYDAKSWFYRLGDDFQGACDYDDLMLLSYVADALHVWKNEGELLGYMGYDLSIAAVAILFASKTLFALLDEQGVRKVYEEIEMPLLPILFDMEKQGFRVKVDALKALGDKYEEELAELTKTIYDYAGESFNINSPKQLGEVLFDKLGLPTDKKRSTAQDKLEHLSYLHPIIPALLRYRQIAKLKSTYIDGMLPLLDDQDKLHTIFRQAVTATGRLSSTEPNLQNIPVRTPEGRLLREAFIASPGNVLVVADYSQIELRIMAHFSADPTMVRSYLNGEDIHAATAAKVYGVPIEEVTHDMRSSCKAVNFGIIYGISDFGLAANIGTSVKRAKQFIDKYFELYPGVKAYMDRIVEEGKRDGYVATLSGRKRMLPELASPVYSVRQFGERVAMNMPLQGTASDIIKIAMIRVFNAFEAHGLKSKMILQVHDELVVDTIPSEVEEVKAILRSEMEGVYKLRVPLVASIGSGDTWVDAK